MTSSPKMAIVIMAALALASCAGSEFIEGEDYGNLLDTPQGLVLTEDEHTDGWGRSACSTCHNLDNIHLVNRTGVPGVDIAAIHDQAITDGDAGCPDCHGTNGVR